MEVGTVTGLDDVEERRQVARVHGVDRTDGDFDIGDGLALEGKDAAADGYIVRRERDAEVAAAHTVGQRPELRRVAFGSDQQHTAGGFGCFVGLGGEFKATGSVGCCGKPGGPVLGGAEERELRNDVDCCARRWDWPRRLNGARANKGLRGIGSVRRGFFRRSSSRLKIAGRLFGLAARCSLWCAGLLAGGGLEGGGEGDQGGHDGQDGERGAPGEAAGERASEIEDGADARFDMGAAGHRDAGGDEAAALTGNLGGDFEQVASIAGAVARRIDGGVVAGLLGQGRELLLEPPGERMEPVQAAVDLGDERDGTVGPLHVHLLVGDHREQLFGRPAPPVGRQEDLWCKSSDGQRHMNARTLVDWGC